MATIQPTLTVERHAILASWTLANGDDGAPVDYPAFPDRTYQVTGTFGAGGSITLEGANIGTYTALTDPQGNAITKTAAAIETVSEVPRYTRPRVTAGDGTTALVATLWMRRGIR